jgi:Asp-tRNA(Asn)/Glu-tRNA(Gln) amidotransferase A subunit family amidase
LKGDFRQVPLDRVVALARSFDHAGPIARGVADVALLQGVLAGTVVEPAATDRPSLAISRELLDRGSPTLRTHLEAVIAQLADAGATVVEVALPPSFAQIVEAGRLILEAEAAAEHEAMFAGHAADYGPGIAELIRAGLARRATELVHAERARAAFRDAMAPLLGAFDALLSPVSPGPAPLRSAGTGDFTLCAPWSFIGVPAISLPTGVDEAGLPLAMQLVGGLGRLAPLLGAAAWAERVVDFTDRPPERP